jgi:hypothetical protein
VSGELPLLVGELNAIFGSRVRSFDVQTPSVSHCPASPPFGEYVIRRISMAVSHFLRASGPVGAAETDIHSYLLRNRFVGDRPT